MIIHKYFILQIWLLKFIKKIFWFEFVNIYKILVFDLMKLIHYRDDYF